MNVRHVTESILTSFLFLSRVWARPTDIVCDGGRGEGDKWFDGCRWCICELSGTLCSSSDCSPLVSQVLPCHKVDSRWWDGCYHCKCHHRGIDCTANETCVKLMRSRRLNPDLLSHGVCVTPVDDRCICGVDGVPSCSAEVIDRNAYPATTIGLNPVIPASSSLVSPSVVYYDRSFGSYYKEGNRIHRPQQRLDSSYIHYVGEKRTKHAHEQHKRLHSLVKRYADEYTTHSEDFYNNKDIRVHIPVSESTVYANVLSSQTRGSFKELFSADGKGFRGIRKLPTPDKAYPRDLNKLIHEGQFYHKNKWREDNDGPNYNGLLDEYSEQRDADDDHNSQWSGDTNREIPQESRRRRMYKENLFKESVDDRSGYVLEDMNLSDDPQVGSSINNAPPSLLITSDNRCRWGVRWYGGSLRCFCGPDNSITCGDPSFVASRIDGFRLEKAACDEGEIWEDDDSCRECECQISGVALCRRSVSCPLPFLIKALPMDRLVDETRVDDSTGEFSGKDIQQVEYNSTDTNPNSIPDEEYREDLINTNIDPDSVADTDTAATDTSPGMKEEEQTTFLQIKGESGVTKTPYSYESIGVTLTDPDDDIGFYVESTSHPDIVIAPKETPYVVDGSLENGHVSGITDSIDGFGNDVTDAIEKYDFKRTTQVIVGECKPESRWLDGCKRCECDQGARKHCDESRCPKAMLVTREMIKATSDFGDKSHSRPVQRPPSNWYLARNRPVDLKPSFMISNLCGRFTVGQKYWDECNMCICLSHGPKCTAKNCA